MAHSRLVDLPMEIIDLIADQLVFKDYVTCLYVNHSWHDLFERLLYKCVDTTHRSMFVAFTQRLAMTAHTPSPLGHYVRELKLCDGFMTHKQMMEMHQLCPNIIALTFRWQDTKTHDQNVDISLNNIPTASTSNTTTTHMTNTHHDEQGSNKRTRTEKVTRRRYFGTPKKIMEMFPTIHRLTLECTLKSRRIRPAPHPIQVYLYATHHLHSLTLTNVFRKLTFSDMDLIHEICPLLIQLDISINTANHASYIMLPRIRMGPEEPSEESQERLRHLDGPEWPLPPGGQPLKIQRISMCDQSGYVNLEKWIRYFAARYPDLQSFSFSNWCYEQLLGWTPSNTTPFLPWQYTSSSTDNMNTDDVEEQEDDGLLAIHCPKLHTIELLDVSIPSNAMKHLFSGRKLKQVSFKCQGSHAIDGRGFTEMTRYLQTKVVSLGIFIPISVVNQSLFFRRSKDAILSYPLFEHLVKLQIICSQRYSSEQLTHLVIDHVLGACPVLKDLTLVSFNVRAVPVSSLTDVVIKNKKDTRQYPSLTTLRLRNVNLSDDSVMKFLSRRCPRLLHLHMLRCTGPQRHLNNDGSRFSIDLPFHQLESLVIYDQHFVQKPDYTNVAAVVFYGSQDLYDHFYWVFEQNFQQHNTNQDENVPAIHPSFSATTPDNFSGIKRRRSAWDDDFRTLEFDDAGLIYPSKSQRLAVKKWTSNEAKRLLNLENKNTQQEQGQQGWISSLLSNKRKRNHDQQEQQEQREQDAQKFKDPWMNECKKEVDHAGYLTICCKSISKLVFNGVYLIDHHGIYPSPPTPPTTTN